MDVPVKQLVSEYVAAVQVPEAGEEEDVFLQGLVDDFQSSSALFKRDMRRRLEKDPPGFLRAACRILKVNSTGPGADYLMELLWGNPVLVASLIDPRLLPLKIAVGFAKRWSEYDPMLDIKLLHMGFPTDGGAICDIDIVRARRVLALLPEHPVLAAATIAGKLGLSERTARSALASLAEHRIVEPYRSPWAGGRASPDRAGPGRAGPGRPRQLWVARELIDLMVSAG